MTKLLALLAIGATLALPTTSYANSENGLPLAVEAEAVCGNLPVLSVSETEITCEGEAAEEIESDYPETYVELTELLPGEVVL